MLASFVHALKCFHKLLAEDVGPDPNSHLKERYGFQPCLVPRLVHLLWRKAEDLNLTPEGAHRFRDGDSSPYCFTFHKMFRDVLPLHYTAGSKNAPHLRPLWPWRNRTSTFPILAESEGLEPYSLRSDPLSRRSWLPEPVHSPNLWLRQAVAAILSSPCGGEHHLSRLRVTPEFKPGTR